jgi:hypothetical protein
MGSETFPVRSRRPGRRGGEARDAEQALPHHRKRNAAVALQDAGEHAATSRPAARLTAAALATLPNWHGAGRPSAGYRRLARSALGLRLAVDPRMTRSYVRASRTTQPIRIPRRRDPVVEDLGFTCYRLVPSHQGLVAIELVSSNNRMFAFVQR